MPEADDKDVRKKVEELRKATAEQAKAAEDLLKLELADTSKKLQQQVQMISSLSKKLNDLMKAVIKDMR